MSLGFSVAVANAILDYIYNTTYPTVYVQLHVGDPGAAGTSNPATETDRVATTMGAAASGAVSNDADADWTAVAGTDDYTHVSLWSASVAGTFIQSGTITANAVTAGDNFSLPAGDIDASISQLAG